MTPESDEDAGSGDGSLEYDEAQESIDESEPSGSEFEVSDSEEDDEIMLDAAVRESLETASSKVASSSKRATGPSREAIKRAEAAERRIARQQQLVSESEDFDSEGLDASSEDEPLAATTAKGKKASKSGSSRMTQSELRKLARERRSANLTAKQAIKKEERAEVKRLGRRLTHVRR